MTQLLITGCARSGTKYLATLLQNAGIRATHERFGFRGAGEVDVSSDAGLDIENAAQQVEAIGHVVRDPHKVVASIVGRGMLDEGWGVRMRAAYPVMRLYDDPIDQALAYWISHNERIGPYAQLRFEVSNPIDGLNWLMFFVAMKPRGKQLGYAMEVVPKDINHRADAPPIEYGWHDHAPELRERAEQMCERYGLRQEAAV